VVIKIS